MDSDDRLQSSWELSTLYLIDAACDRFEVAWRTGKSPRIEDYLAGWPRTDRKTVFWELLAVELELRREAGENPTAEDYRTRFPEDASGIDVALRECSTGWSEDLSGTLRISARPLSLHNDGRSGSVDLTGILAQEEFRHRGRYCGELTTRSTGGQDRLVTTLTATDLTDAPGEITEEMTGSREPFSDQRETTTPAPDTIFQSISTEDLEPTERDLDDPSSNDPDATINSDDPSRPSDRMRPGVAPNVGMKIPGYGPLEKLGEGGMGVVYKARQMGLNRLVALKMIRGGSRERPDQLTRFRIEAETIAQLRHPHILQIYDIGTTDDRPFLALELLDGGSLADRLAGTPQPGRTAAELMVILARAVHAAHQAGIIHRDLKPTNILFTANGIPKISDFGLAKRMESEGTPTESGLIMGSPSYMAPEQALGRARHVGPASDIYSLGAILYEMLTGRPPFKGETPVETVRQVTDDDPVPPTRLVPRLDRDLETICLKCLSKDPSRRYASANDLADDLERFLKGEAIKARSAGWWEHGVKWARRRPAVATLTALTLTAALLLAGTGWWLVRREGLRVDQLRSEVVPSLLLGQSLLAREKWSDAKEPLIKAHTQSLNEPQLVELHGQAEALLVQAERGQDEQEARVADREARDADQKRYREFVRLRDEALIHDTHVIGLDTLNNLDETRRAAQAALAIFADSDSGEPETPASLSQAQRDEIREGYHVLLLVLAEASEQPDQGLRLLDRAARFYPPTRAYHLRRGACLSRGGNLAGAAKERQAADRVPPTTAFDHFLAGQERYQRRDWIAAKQQFDTVLLLKPDDFWAHCLSAKSGLNLRQPLAARAELTACLRMEPDLPWLYMLRGLAFQQAAVMSRSAAENSRASASLLQSEAQFQLAAAEADFDKALKLLGQHPNDEIRYQALVNRGLLWLERRDWDKAVADLQAAITLNGRQHSAYEALGQVRWRQNQPDEAIVQFSRAIDVRPDWAPLYRARADVELARQDATPAQQVQALDDLEQAIRLSAPDDPVKARDYTTRGRLLHLDGRDPEALAACETALKLVPSYANAHRLRLDVLLAMKRYDEVIRSCDALLARESPSFALYELRGLARAGRRDYAGAIEDGTKALSLNPDSVPLLVRRGSLYLITDAPQLAVRDFEEAIRLGDSSREAYLGRGSARVRLGEYRKAVADVERALHLGKPTALMAYNAARVLSRAAVAASSEVRKKGQDAVVQVNRYQDRAIELIQDAIKRLPADQRAAFLGEVLNDPDLAVIRRRLRSVLSISPTGSRPKS